MTYDIKLGLRVGKYLFDNGLDIDNLLTDRSVIIEHFTGTLSRISYWSNNIPIAEPSEEQLSHYTDEDLNSYILEKKNNKKPLEQKSYENGFFMLIAQILTLAGEPVPTPIPKLGFMQLNGMLETLLITHPQEAVVLSLKLLSVDSALKRYNIMWWDEANFHII